MTPEQGRYFLQALNAKNIAAKPDGKWLKASCVLAPWFHQGADKNPSFGISLSDNETARFHCFGCSESGTAAELVGRLQMYVAALPELKAQYDFKKAYQVLDDEELTPFSLPEYGSTVNEQTVFKPWPELWVQSFMPAENVELARDYLFGAADSYNQFGQRRRGFTPEMIAPFDLRFDHKRGMVCFPYRDAFGRLAGMRGRSIYEKTHHDYTWESVNNAHQCWYNEPALNLPGWVVVVEGQMDAMRTAWRWPKTVANMTAAPTATKLKKLLHADGTILIPDNDAGGVQSVARYREYHKEKQQPFRVFRLPEGIKDPDECHPDWLYDQIVELIS